MKRSKDCGSEVTFMRLFGRMLVVATLVAAVAPTARAQGFSDFMNRWFWGVEAGVSLYRTNLVSISPDVSGADYTAAPTFGVNWLITASRVALQLSFEETLFTRVAETLIEDPNSATGFTIMRSDELRRFGATLIALPLQNQLQPFAGIGIAIQQSGGVRPQAADGVGLLTNAELNAALDNAERFSTNAALTFLAGINYYLNNKWMVYGQYKVAAGDDDFLLDKSIHTFSGGVRFNFGSAREGTDSRF